MIDTNPIAVVFGGTGFIGRLVVQRLAKAGYIIRVPTRRPAAALYLQPLGQVGQIVALPCNLSNEKDIAAAVSGADTVINLIGILSERRRGDFQRIHVDLARHIATAAHKAHVKRFVHFSALGASATSPSIYARTKAGGEQVVHFSFPTATIVRPSVVFGPEDHFFNRFASLARFLPALPLIGGGETRFQPVYVGDVADAVLRIVENKNTAGETYELGGPHILTFKQILQRLLEEIDRKRLLIPLPWHLAVFSAFFLEHLPNSLLTRDQVKLLHKDNVVSPKAKTLTDLHLSPKSIDLILPTYLGRFRTGGPFHQKKRAVT